jgi:hypothetical protein
MTGQEFLRWLERSSMDPSCKRSVGEQVGLMRAEIIDVNVEVFKRAIENLAELNSNSSTRSAVSSELQDRAIVRKSAYGAGRGER